METEQGFQTEEFLTAAIAWAKEVGKIHLAYFRGNNLDIHTKSNVSDVVTRADRESEAYLLEKIAERFPTHSVLGEESGMHEKNTDFCWVIDPLDGTNNYSQGLPVFTVSIGLQYRGHTLIGLVYAPYFDELYTAERGKGAFLNGRPLRVSDKTELESCVLGTGFPYDKGTNPENNISNLAVILPGLRGIRRMGSAAYDLCCVAAGFLDGYWELNLNLWDVCAGELLVEEAGGCICPFRQDRHVSIIAANPVLVEKIRHIIR